MSVVMFQSGTHWLRPQTCQQCRCDNGVLYCTRQTCPDNPLCPQVGLPPPPTPPPPFFLVSPSLCLIHSLCFPLSLSLFLSLSLSLCFVSPSPSLSPSVPFFVSITLCFSFTHFVSFSLSFSPSVCVCDNSGGGDPDVSGYEFCCMLSSYHMMNVIQKQDEMSQHDTAHSIISRLYDQHHPAVRTGSAPSHNKYGITTIPS